MIPEIQSEPIRILLVEDNPGDVLLTTEALKNGKMVSIIDVVKDGAEALAFLRGEGRYESRNLPDLVILDLNLPKKNGREVLSEIKSDDELRYLPVVILTTSDASEDIREAYRLYANCYVTKPVDYENFTTVVKLIEDFWFSAVKLPCR